jgi:hypothetical protein
VIVALLLVGFGVWQAWHCTDATMTSPMAATTMGHDSFASHTAEPVRVSTDEKPAPGMPTGVAALCITVLASLAAALVLTSSPLRLLGLLRPLGQFLWRPVIVPAKAPALAHLGISRT